MSNFDFLKDEYPELAKLAYLAECYYKNDPVSSLAKMRTFCEYIVKDIYIQEAPIPNDTKFADLIRFCRNKELIPDKIANLIDIIRIKGNGHNLIWARIGLYLSDILKIKPRYFEDENRCGDITPEEIEKFVNDPNIKLGIFTLMKELDSSEGHLPRQNVVDEAARFSTKLGREHVLLIVEEGIQPPTNLSGIVYLSYKGDDEGLMLKIKDFVEKFS